MKLANPAYPTAGELKAIAKMPADDRRRHLRMIVSFKHGEQTKLDPRIDWSSVVKQSSLCGSGPKQISVRPGFTGVRDALPEDVLWLLAANELSHGLLSKQVNFSIRHCDGDPLSPLTFQYLAHIIKHNGHSRDIEGGPRCYATSTKTGFSFGLPVEHGLAGSPKKIKSLIYGLKNNTRYVDIDGNQYEHIPYKSEDYNMQLSDLNVTQRLDLIDLRIAAIYARDEIERMEDFEIDNAKAQAREELRTVFGSEEADKFLPPAWNLFQAREGAGQTPDYSGSITHDEPVAKANQKVADYHSTSTSIDETSEGDSTMTTPTFDEKFKPTLDLVLSQATDGAYKDIGALFESLSKAKQEADERKSEADTLRSKLSTTTMSRPKTVAKTGDGTIPDGTIEWKNANDVFGNGKKHKLLNFEVPVFVWDGEHPHVPEVDENYVFKPIMLSALLSALVKGKKALLHGHTGTGKSTLVEQVCARLNYPMMRVNFDSEITRMDLVGRDTLTKDGESTVSKFVEGILPMAMKQPCILLCDELDFVRPDIAYVMQRALEDKGLMLTEDGGRVIEPHEMFRMVGTANTRLQGDEFGAYQGARHQSEAFRNRFTRWIEVPYLSRDEEAELIQNQVPAIDKNTALEIASFGKECREAFVGGETYLAVSPRDLLSLADDVAFYQGLTATTHQAVELCLEMNLFDKASPQDKAVIQRLAKGCFSKAPAKKKAA